MTTAEVYLSASISQIEVSGKSVGVEVFSVGMYTNPDDIYKDPSKKALEEV